MGFRHSLALNVAPLLLRVALGVTFIYAGWGKLFEKSEFAPEQLAILANMGFGGAKDAAIGQSGPVEAAPQNTPPVEPVPDEALPEPERSGALPHGGRITLVRQVVVPPDAPQHRAEDFAESKMLSRTHFIGLALHDAAHPADGGRRLLPAGLVNKPWGKALAYGACITEFVGGILILIGLLSRLAALGLAVVMGMAIWLTTIGPSLGAPKALLGFLPALGDFQSDSWYSFSLQLCLFCAALAVFFSGPGSVSFDGLLLGRRRGGGGADEDAEDEE